ncbi:Group 2/22 mite allergen-like protein (lipid binding protein) [Euroglyphus maynei]|uniref:Group 2/22 mite allergen-like protein (Lipid binding protein) n=1 Tax=Euroglyphus maynei TaxID=6958 RepID=A0A1Y3AYL9_EURMA|nr:Group 2/22 mite allergen-like protein (lipid binding protein) [Euroglyphus maynei]
MNLGFISDKAIDSVKVKIFGEVARVQVPFIISPEINLKLSNIIISEACGNYGFKCPLIVGHTNRFSLTLPIKPIYPAIPVTIQINLMAGDTKDKVVCVRFKARISN